MPTSLLKFGIGNAKLGENVATFSLPAGHSCPSAHLCLAKADPVKGFITDGPNAEFRCFSASSEAAFPTVRKARHHNFDLLRQLRESEPMRDLILQSIPKSEWVRIHVSGDFYAQAYFDAWMLTAEAKPEQKFYAYTKELEKWVHAQQLGLIPTNMSLVASRGGRHDHLIERCGLREAVVVKHPSEAQERGWEIDHDDSLARDPKGPKVFALLLHGPQKAGTEAAESIRAMKAEGIKYSYSSNK